MCVRVRHKGCRDRTALLALNSGLTCSPHPPELRSYDAQDVREEGRGKNRWRESERVRKEERGYIERVVRRLQWNKSLVAPPVGNWQQLP